MFELQTIRKDTSVYLKRWRIFGYLSLDDNNGLPIRSKLPFTLRIHKFCRPDEDRAPHNHPWSWALSFIFWGGYTERRFYFETGEVEYKTHRAPALNFIRHSDYHDVVELLPTAWTLFLTGPKKSSWGFWDRGKHVDWKEFLGL